MAADTSSSSSARGAFNPLGFLGGGMLGGGLGSLFGGNPAEAANPYMHQALQYIGNLGSMQNMLGQIPGQLQNIYSPFMQQGQSMWGPLSSQLSSLMGNPGGVLNQIGGGYSASPGYEWMRQQALQAGQQAANAGGMAGTPMNQQSQMQLATQLANQDYYNWLNQATGMYGQGLQGAQNIYGSGLNAANMYGGGLQNIAGLQSGLAQNQAQMQAELAARQAQLASSGQSAQNQGTGNFLGGLLGLAGSFIPGGGFLSHLFGS